jgi:Ca2+-binding RTX toxin-like protein
VNTVDRAVTLSVTDVAEGQPSSGNDVLSGSPGADMLNGGLGNDLLTGKSGSDTFAFNTKLHKTKNVDHITDFEVGIDTIQLDRSIVKKLKVGDLKAKAFTAGKVKGDDRIIYDKKNGDLFYDVDGKGGKKAVKFAILDNHPDNLSADDFTIVA